MLGRSPSTRMHNIVQIFWSSSDLQAWDRLKRLHLRAQTLILMLAGSLLLGTKQAQDLRFLFFPSFGHFWEGCVKVSRILTASSKFVMQRRLWLPHVDAWDYQRLVNAHFVGCLLLGQLKKA